MSREKQIDEIAKLICTYPQCIHYNIIGECANAECQIVDIAEHLYNAGYRKQGENVVELPCKVGDKVYQTDGVRIYENTINEITLASNKMIFVTENIAFDETAIGEGIFLTKAKAEAKMKGGASNG
jgi:hypothetical protein